MRQQVKGDTTGRFITKLSSAHYDNITVLLLMNPNCTNSPLFSLSKVGAGVTPRPLPAAPLQHNAGSACRTAGAVQEAFHVGGVGGISRRDCSNELRLEHATGNNPARVMTIMRSPSPSGKKGGGKNLSLLETLPAHDRAELTYIFACLDGDRDGKVTCEDVQESISLAFGRRIRQAHGGWALPGWFSLPDPLVLLLLPPPFPACAVALPARPCSTR